MSETTISLAVPNEIHTTRELDAPIELVWAAFTTSEHAVVWWGPEGFTTKTLEMDVRVGGVWSHTMHAPDGTVFPNFVRYTAVEPLARLAWEHGTHEGVPPLFRAEVRLEALSPKRTRLVLKHVFPTGELRDENIAKYGSVEGAKQMLVRFAAWLAARQA